MEVNRKKANNGKLRATGESKVSMVEGTGESYTDIIPCSLKTDLSFQFPTSGLPST